MRSKKSPASGNMELNTNRWSLNRCGSKKSLQMDCHKWKHELKTSNSWLPVFHPMWDFRPPAPSDFSRRIPVLKVGDLLPSGRQQGLEGIDQLQEGGGRGVVDALQAVPGAQRFFPGSHIRVRLAR